jgi:hypothetical protein
MAAANDRHRIALEVSEELASAAANAAEFDLISVAAVTRQALAEALRRRGLFGVMPTDPRPVDPEKERAA